MFCRNCGQPIEDDSKFCKHCGASVEQPSKGNSSKSIKAFYGKFVSLESKWQVLILSYVLWVFVWVCVVIITGIEGDSEGYGIAMLLAFIAIFVLPFVIFAAMHIARLQKAKKKTIDNIKKESMESDEKSIGAEDSKAEDVMTEVQPVIEELEINYGVEMERFTLKEFSLLYGKMQVKTVKLEDGELQSYCTFTNGEIETRVEFDKKLGSLSAPEISSLKESLCIVEYENRNFVLTKTVQS